MSEAGEAGKAGWDTSACASPPGAAPSDPKSMFITIVLVVVILVLVFLLVLVQQRISWSGGAVVITRRMDKHAKRFARDAGALEHEREDEHEHGEDHNADGGDERSDGGEPTSDIVVKESEVELELGVIVEVDEDEDEGSEVRGAGVTYS